MVSFGGQVLGNELDDAGGELVEVDVDDEVEATRSLPTPYMPSQSERDMFGYRCAL